MFQFSHNLFHPISCFLGGTVEIGQHSRDEASLIGDSTYGRFQKPMSREQPPPSKNSKKFFHTGLQLTTFEEGTVCFMSGFVDFLGEGGLKLLTTCQVSTKLQVLTMFQVLTTLEVLTPLQVLMMLQVLTSYKYLHHYMYL